MQLNDDEYVAEEAEAFADWSKDQLSSTAQAKLLASNVRFEFGDGNDLVVTTPEGEFSFAGWSSLYPAAPQVHAVLLAISGKVDGVFEDNVNGVWLAP